MTGLEEKLKDAILTIGRNLPVGMEIHFYREDGCERPRMQVIYPDNSNTEYAVLQSSPLPLKDVALALMFERFAQMETVMWDLLATIELHTDITTGMINGAVLNPYVEKAEGLLFDSDFETHPTTVPAIASYPMGSMGEAVELEGGDLCL